MSDAPVFAGTTSGLSLFGSAMAVGTALPAQASATVVGASGQSSLFSNGAAVFGMERGALLTTGSGTPGTQAHQTLSVSHGRGGDAGLDGILGRAGFTERSLDANVLTVNFWNASSTVRSVTFDLVFATEERLTDGYPDVAGVWVNGTSVALVGGNAARPLGAVPVNAGMFIDADRVGLPSSYDAVTVRMTVSAPVKVGANTIKFAIGDAGDRDYDSALAIGNMRLGTAAPTGTFVPVDARDDLLACRAGSLRSGNLLQDNGFGADYGVGHRVGAVNGVAARVGQTIVLESGARLLVRADGSFSYDPRTIASALIADGFHVDRVEYTLRDSTGRWTDVATATFGVYRVNAAAPVQLSFDAIGADSVGFASLGSAIAAIASLSDTMSGIQFELGNNINAGGHRVGLADFTIKMGAGSRVGLTFLSSVESFRLAGPGAVSIAGNNNANEIRAGEGNDTIYAFGGDDLILGGGGTVNYLSGGAGNDTIIGGSGADIINGDAGRDFMQGGAGNDKFRVDTGDFINGGSGNDTAALTEPGRYVVGSAAVELWAGSPGRDAIDGSFANHTMYIYGADGDDTLSGGSAVDLLVGMAGNDSILGGGGGDRLIGNIGNDTLAGEGGADVLQGGPGADVFRFGPGTRNDQIIDWEDGVDRIDFSEHDGVEALSDLTITRSGLTAFIFYSDDQTDFIVLFNAYANGAQLTAADFIF